MRTPWFGSAVLAGVFALPAPAADDPPTQKEFAASQNNLKQIGIAFHGYAGTFEDKWADDITDKDGRSLLSWRVAILPYIEQEALYKQFKLDEPWDSDTNKKLSHTATPTSSLVRRSVTFSLLPF